MGWLRRLRGTLIRSGVGDSVDEELRFHVDERTDEFIRCGMTPDEARREALRRFGNLTITREHTRDVVTLRWLGDLGQDVQYGIRTLRKNAGFTAVSIGTLALGIGANTAIFTVVRAVLLKPPPYVDANRLVLLKETRPGTPDYSGAISGPNYLDWADQNTVFEQMAGVTGGEATLSGDGIEPVYVEGRRVSASYFDVFGLRAARGRTFARDEDQPAKSHVVVISHRLWASHFGSDPAAVGRPIRLDGELYTVIGVMPAGTGVDLLDPELWRPRDLGRQGGAITFDGHTTRGMRDLNRAVAKLKPGVTLQEARTQMGAIADRLAQAYPASNKGWGVSVELWPRPVDQNFEESLHLLLAAVGMVLLIGCVNISTLTLTRGTARVHEMAIRAALGAGRGRLVRQSLTESVVMAIGGGLCGLVVGYALLAAMKTAIPFTGTLNRAVPAETTMTMDTPVWLFALTLSVLSGIAFGLAPAFGSTRRALAASIKEGGRGAGVGDGRAQRRLRQTLVAAEVALSFVLLISASLLIQSFFALQRRIDIGFDSTNVLTARLPIAERRLDNPEALNSYLDQLASRIQSLPGVRDVAFTEGLPTQGTPFGESFQIADQPPVEPSQWPTCGFKTVSASYFRAVGLRMLKGRALSDRDREGAPLAVVINETFARAYFPGLDPIGQRLLMGGWISRTPLPWAVVGVVADEGVSPFGGRAPQAMVYATREQNPTDFLSLVVRATLDPMHLQESIRKTISTFDRDQALTNIRTLDQLKRDDMASDGLRSLLLGAFAAIAVALAAIGLYGVISHAVVQRTREIGIRAALGATPASLMALVVRQGLVMTGYGLILGLGGAIVARRVLATLVFGVRSGDPMTMVAGAALLALVALLACYFPARRATRVDPCTALRLE